LITVKNVSEKPANKILNNKFSSWSIIFSAISLIGNAFLNYKLYSLYIKASGKTQALFGMIELSHLHYKIYIFIAGLIALIFSLIALQKKETRSRLSILLSTISLLLVFVRIWHLFI